MKREAFKMFLKPGFEKEYEKRHAAIWPELKQMLSENGVYDYSIYWDKDTNILFDCQKTTILRLLFLCRKFSTWIKQFCTRLKKVHGFFSDALFLYFCK